MLATMTLNLDAPNGASTPMPAELPSFQDIYDTHLEAVMRTLHGGFSYRLRDGSFGHVRIKSAFDAEDLCQETFSRFFDQIKRNNFDPSRPIRPYLLQIARNQALRKLGKSSREVLTEDDPGTETQQAPPETGVLHEEQRRLLETFIDTLEPPDDDILRLHMQDNQSQRLTGEKLGLSRDQVARAVIRIRKKARMFFTEKGWFHGS